MHVWTMYTGHSFLFLQALGNKRPSLQKTGTPLKLCAACYLRTRVWYAFSNVVLCPEGNHSNLQGTGLSVTNSQFEKWISVDKFLWYSYSLLSARTKLEVALRKIMLWIPHHIMTITLFVEHSKSVVGDQLEFMYMACICTLIPHCKHSK